MPDSDEDTDFRDLRLAHRADPLGALRPPTADRPWRILVSGCLAGLACGVEGTDYGLGGTLRAWAASPLARLLPFCPEHHGLGTPRPMPDLHGGDGFDVLAGRARVLAPDGRDLTAAMIAGGAEMVRVARAEAVDLAILTDGSAACGTQVVHLGDRALDPLRVRRGVGVAAAMLLRAGIPVVAQRDHRAMGLLLAAVDPTARPDPAALDHHDHPWVREHLPR